MKHVLKIVAIVLAVLIVIVIALPFFIDANLFRPRIESELTSALGRQVKVGNLSLSILKGGVTADDISIADDPAFNKAPFVKAKSLNVGVELMPLIFSDDDFALMRRVHDAFNPNSALNPGKIFPLNKGCGEIRVRSKSYPASLVL